MRAKESSPAKHLNGKIETALRVLVGMPDSESTGGPVACEPPFVAELRRAGLSVHEETYVHADKGARANLWTRIKRVLRTASRFRRRLKRESFDLVHLNTSFDRMALLRDVVTLLYLRRSPRAKIFLKFHGSDAALLNTSNPLLRFLGRWLLARADGIGALSSEEKENFLRAGVDARRVFLIKNVVREILDQRSEGFAEKLKIDAGTPVLLFIARFIHAKGLVDVVRACGIVRERGIDFMLLCVGDGEARAEAESLAARENLQSCVRFCGYVAEEMASEFYVNATMLVFPTYHYEGFPMVIFNSVAAGIPIITTRIRAAADYLREPDNCLWVAPKNPELLAEKIVQLLTHPEERETMRRNNEKLAQQFTAEVVTREYIDIYEQLVKDVRTNQ
jgi:glycosyltransferase involved in cell wall biosynthesis